MSFLGLLENFGESCFYLSGQRVWQTDGFPSRLSYCSNCTFYFFQAPVVTQSLGRFKFRLEKSCCLNPEYTLLLSQPGVNNLSTSFKALKYDLKLHQLIFNAWTFAMCDVKCGGCSDRPTDNSSLTVTYFLSAPFSVFRLIFFF